MIRKLAAALRTVDLAPVVAAAAITWGLGRLKQLLEERQQQLVDLEQQLAAGRDERRALLVEIGQLIGRQEYPGRGDLDPLERAVVDQPAEPVPA